MTRKRALSNQGLELFNIALSKPGQNTCFRSIIYNLFSSDFDEKLEKSLEQFRKSSYKLYSYLNENEIHLIPTYFNNAVVNLIYLIMIGDDNINNLRQVKKNLMFS